MKDKKGQRRLKSHLSLSDSDELSKVIPEERDHLTRLIEDNVDVSSCYLDGEGHIFYLSLEPHGSLSNSFFFPKLEVLYVQGGKLLDTPSLNLHRELVSVTFLKCGLFKIPHMDALVKLRSLDFFGMEISKISGLDSLLNLKELELSSNKIERIEGLDSLVNLEKLLLSGNRIASLKGLENLKSLKRLYLSRNEIHDLNRFKDLSTLRDLEIIDLSSNKIADLNITHDLPRMTKLNLNDNRIFKISAFKNISSLEELDLRRNKIAKIENFSNLPNLKLIYVNNNPITSFSGLENLTHPFDIKEIDKKNFTEQDIENLKKYVESVDLMLYFGPPGDDFSEYDTFILYRPLGYFKVNDYITLELTDQLETLIHVKGVPFTQCKFLLLTLPKENVPAFNNIDSIDEAEEILAVAVDHTEVYIPPKTEFWGHSSNLQAWAENDYDTRLLHRNLAFPLLKELTYAGDPVAKKVFKEEIARRYASGHPAVVNYLKEQKYLNLLSKEELEAINF